MLKCLHSVKMKNLNQWPFDPAAVKNSELKVNINYGVIQVISSLNEFLSKYELTLQAMKLQVTVAL